MKAMQSALFLSLSLSLSVSVSLVFSPSEKIQKNICGLDHIKVIASTTCECSNTGLHLYIFPKHKEQLKMNQCSRYFNKSVREIKRATCASTNRHVAIH